MKAPLPLLTTTWSSYSLFLTAQSRQNTFFLRVDRTFRSRGVESLNQAISFKSLPRPFSAFRWSPWPSLTPPMILRPPPNRILYPLYVILATLTPPTNLPPDVIGRLDDHQRESCLRLWDTVPSHIRTKDWDPAAIDALSSTLTDFADVFSSSKLNYGECSPRPSEI